MAEGIKVYCGSCGQAQILEIEEMSLDDLNGDRAWGDLLCSVCRLVIATIDVPEVGTYEFIKVGKRRSAENKGADRP